MAKDIEKNTPDELSEAKEESRKSDEKSKDKSKKAKGNKPKKGIVKFFKDAKSEFKKVVWPSPKETTHNTVVVIIFCLLAGVFIFGIDSLFGLLNNLLFTG